MDPTHPQGRVVDWHEVLGLNRAQNRIRNPVGRLWNIAHIVIQDLSRMFRVLLGPQKAPSEPKGTFVVLRGAEGFLRGSNHRFGGDLLDSISIQRHTEAPKL